MKDHALLHSDVLAGHHSQVGQPGEDSLDRHFHVEASHPLPDTGVRADAEMDALAHLDGVAVDVEPLGAAKHHVVVVGRLHHQEQLGTLGNSVSADLDIFLRLPQDAASGRQTSQRFLHHLGHQRQVIADPGEKVAVVAELVESETDTTGTGFETGDNELTEDTEDFPVGEALIVLLLRQDQPADEVVAGRLAPLRDGVEQILVEANLLARQFEAPGIRDRVQ